MLSVSAEISQRLTIARFLVFAVHFVHFHLCSLVTSLNKLSEFLFFFLANCGLQVSFSRNRKESAKQQVRVEWDRKWRHYRQLSRWASFAELHPPTRAGSGQRVKEASDKVLKLPTLGRDGSNGATVWLRHPSVSIISCSLGVATAYPSKAGLHRGQVSKRDIFKT